MCAFIRVHSTLTPAACAFTDYGCQFIIRRTDSADTLLRTLECAASNVPATPLANRDLVVHVAKALSAYNLDQRQATQRSVIDLVDWIVQLSDVVDDSRGREALGRITECKQHPSPVSLLRILTSA